MYNQIKQSLEEIDNDSIELGLMYTGQPVQRKSNSFTELSDWNSKNKYKFSKSIGLPRISQESSKMRKVQSQLGNYLMKRNKKIENKSMDLKAAKKNNIGEYFEEKPMKQFKSDLDLAKQSIISKAMARKNKLRRKEFYDQYIKRYNGNYQHY